MSMQMESFQVLPVVCFGVPDPLVRQLVHVIHDAGQTLSQLDALDDVVETATCSAAALIFVGIADIVEVQESVNALLMAIDTQQSIVIAVPVTPTDKERVLSRMGHLGALDSGNFADILDAGLSSVELRQKCRLYLELQQRRCQEQRNQHWRLYHEHYHDILHAHAQEGIVLTSDAGKILDINPFAASALGYSQEALIGQHLSLLLCGPESSDPTLDWLEHPIYQAYTLDPEFAPQQVSLRRSDGEAILVGCQILIFDKRYEAQRLVIFQDLTLQKREETKLAQLTRYDPVTGLASIALLRHFLLKAMARVLRNDRKLAVVCVDLDDFHCINENFGYRMGDQLLNSVGRRLKRCIRTGDLVSRYEEDAFLVVLDEIRRPDDATKLAGQMLAAVSQPHDLNGVSVIANASLGVALYPSGTIGIEELILRAVHAKDKVKKQGKHGWHLHAEPAVSQADKAPPSPLMH